MHMPEGLERSIKEKEAFWKKPPIPEKEKPLGVREEAFYLALDSFPERTQGFVASLSASFLEPDVYKEFRGTKGCVSSLRRRLQRQGLRREQAELVLDFFDLPHGKPNIEDESR